MNPSFCRSGALSWYVLEPLTEEPYDTVRRMTSWIGQDLCLGAGVRRDGERILMASTEASLPDPLRPGQGGNAT